MWNLGVLHRVDHGLFVVPAIRPQGHGPSIGSARRGPQAPGGGERPVEPVEQGLRVLGAVARGESAAAPLSFRTAST